MDGVSRVRGEGHGRRLGDILIGLYETPGVA